LERWEGTRGRDWGTMWEWDWVWLELLLAVSLRTDWKKPKEMVRRQPTAWLRPLGIDPMEERVDLGTSRLRAGRIPRR
jgi:hypothetical protein